MYSYVIRMSLVCTRMSSVCHSYVLVCHPYVTRMWLCHKPFAYIVFLCIRKMQILMSKKTTNATRCNKHDDVLLLSFVLLFSIFSESSLEPSRASMIEIFWENNKLLTIFTKKLHHRCSLGF